MNDSSIQFDRVYIKEELNTYNQVDSIIKTEPDDYNLFPEDNNSANHDTFVKLIENIKPKMYNVKPVKKSCKNSQFEANTSRMPWSLLEWKVVTIGREIIVEDEYHLLYEDYLYRDISGIYYDRTCKGPFQERSKKIRNYKCANCKCPAAMRVDFGITKNKLAIKTQCSTHTCGFPVKVVNLVPNAYHAVPLEEQSDFRLLRNFDCIKFRGYMHSKNGGFSMGVKGMVYICPKYKECRCRGSILFNDHVVLEYRDHFCEDISGDITRNFHKKYPDVAVIYPNGDLQPRRRVRLEVFYNGFSYIQDEDKSEHTKWNCSQSRVDYCPAYFLIHFDETNKKVCQMKMGGIHECTKLAPQLESDCFDSPLPSTEEFSTVKVKDFRLPAFEAVPIAEQALYEPICSDTLPFNQGGNFPDIIFRGYQHSKKGTLVDDSVIYECPHAKLKKCPGMLSCKGNKIVSFRGHLCKATKGKESIKSEPGDQSTLFFYYNSDKMCKELFFNGFNYFKSRKRTLNCSYYEGHITTSTWLCSKRVEMDCPGLIGLRDNYHIKYVTESMSHTCSSQK